MSGPDELPPEWPPRLHPQPQGRRSRCPYRLPQPQPADRQVPDPRRTQPPTLVARCCRLPFKTPICRTRATESTGPEHHGVRESRLISGQFTTHARFDHHSGQGAEACRGTVTWIAAAGVVSTRSGARRRASLHCRHDWQLPLSPSERHEERR
jgi:hypothetical protein